MSDWFEVLALAGITGIITRSYLLQGVRDAIKIPKLKYLINCPQCTGFWVGFIYAFFISSPSNILFNIVLWAGAVSLFSSATVTGLDYLSFAKSRLLNEIANDAASLVINSQEAEDGEVNDDREVS